MVMPKALYTESDIEQLHARGVTSLDVHDHRGVVLTESARERALQLGIRLNRTEPMSQPGGEADADLIQRVTAAVVETLARETASGTPAAARMEPASGSGAVAFKDSASSKGKVMRSREE
jgi:hypothetical protein